MCRRSPRRRAQRARTAAAPRPGARDRRVEPRGWAHTCALRGRTPGVAVLGPRALRRARRGVRGHRARRAQLAAGGDATCAVRRGGRVLCWRARASGGGAAASPTRARSPSGPTSAACCARAAACCAGATTTRARSATAPRRTRRTPVAVSGVAGAVRVAAGGDRACAVRRDRRGVVLGRGAAGPGRRRRAWPGPSEVAVADDVRVRAALAGGRVACWATGTGEQGTTWLSQRRRPDGRRWQAGPAPADVPGVDGRRRPLAGGRHGAACAVARERRGRGAGATTPTARSATARACRHAHGGQPVEGLTDAHASVRRSAPPHAVRRPRRESGAPRSAGAVGRRGRARRTAAARRRRDEPRGGRQRVCG